MEIALRDAPPFTRWVRRGLVAWRRRQRRRERSCVRCGVPAAGICPACRSRVCTDCSILSIETGSPIALCLGCSGATGFRTGFVRPRFSPWLLFRRGAALLLLVIAIAAGVALERHGWAGAWRVLLAVLHPAVLLGILPLALVLGGVVTLLRRLLFGTP